MNNIEKYENELKSRMSDTVYLQIISDFAQVEAHQRVLFITLLNEYHFEKLGRAIYRKKFKREIIARNYIQIIANKMPVR